MSAAEPSVAMLGRLLAALQVMDSVPGAADLFAFLVRTLNDLPGVGVVRFAPRGEAAGARPGSNTFTVRTSERDFGTLIVDIQDEESFAPYRPFVGNVGHVVARILENREVAKDLAEANTRLGTYIGSLEADAVQRRIDAEEHGQRLRLVLESAGLGMWDWNMQTGAAVVDERWAAIVGYSLAELEPVTEDTWLQMTHPDDIESDRKAGEEHAAGRTPIFDVEIRLRHRSGHWVWCRDRGRIVQWTDDGRPFRMTGTLEDVTAHVEARQRLERSEMLLSEAQRIAHVGAWRFDLATGAVTWSQELFDAFGLDPLGAVPGFPEQEALFTPESWLALSSAVLAARTDGVPYDVELQTVRTDGTHGWIHARGQARRDALGSVVELHGMTLDITELKASTDVLREMATHDSLTGLANRAALMDEISRSLSAGRRSGRSTAVLMIDLDRFKGLNDALGHAVGDDVLVAAAARILRVVRTSDLVARLGGDEFVIVMRDLQDPEEAVGAATRIVQAFREQFNPGGAEMYATASVGLAIATDDDSAGDVLRAADTAMYAAKEQGRDRVSIFNEDMREKVATRLAVETDLRHALARDQLAVWYQPEVDLKTGSVVAVEALLRWIRPDGTVWCADRFIKVAEDTGMILDIGDWVLRQACAQAAAWGADRPGRPITVRVNLSTLQLAESGLLDAVDDALAASGVDPALLCIEITETSMLQETANARENLAGLHSRGISLAIDDFGTGYGSLTYLNRYPIDVIKIDRSFITDTTDPDHDHRLVAGIVALATALGITVTAEGVEHTDQAAHLLHMGCPTAQGWLYSEALPADQITLLLDHIYPARAAIVTDYP